MRARFLPLLAALLFTPFLQAQEPASYKTKLAPLLSCYEAWCGNGWRQAAAKVRTPERPSRKECHGFPGRTAQDGVSPVILPPSSPHQLDFLIFLNGNAYTCHVEKVAQAFCKKDFDQKPCDLEDTWSFLTFAIPGENLNLPQDLDLKLTREMELGRNIGDLESARRRSRGQSVCRQNNSIENGQKLQDFLKNVLKKEASRNAFDLHVQKMKNAADDARKKETTYVEAQWGGESTKSRIERETTFEWIKRIATHMTQPYSKKSKPVSEEDVQALKDLYLEQLQKCAKAQSLQTVADDLARDLDKKSRDVFSFGSSGGAVK